MERIAKVEILGLLPTLFATKCKVYCNPTGVAGIRSFDQQMEEYPEEVLRNQARIASIFENLVKDFPGQVLVKVVTPTSLTGMWLSLKHRLPYGLWLIINGRTAVDAYSDYSIIRRAIGSELGGPLAVAR